METYFYLYYFFAREQIGSLTFISINIINIEFVSYPNYAWALGMGTNHTKLGTMFKTTWEGVRDSECGGDVCVRITCGGVQLRWVGDDDDDEKGGSLEGEREEKVLLLFFGRGEEGEGEEEWDGCIESKYMYACFRLMMSASMYVFCTADREVWL